MSARWMICLSLGVAAAFAQSLPPRLKVALQKDLRATAQQIQKLENGGIIAYVLDQPDPEDIVLVGAARIWISPAKFVAAYRDIERFEASPDVLAGAKFSKPPRGSDLAGLRLAKEEVDDLLACRPGECAFKVSDSTLNELRSKIDRADPTYVERTNRLIHSLWIDYLIRYQASGNKALSVYHDTPKYESVQQGFETLLRQSDFLREHAPGMMNYLANYPSARLPNSDEFFYWQVGDFGLKPVHRASHVVIERIPATFGDGYLIASKMLFASHYFRSALELRFLIPGEDRHKGEMLYLVAIQRSYVDGLKGFKGRMLRPIVLGKSRESVERYIASAKDRLEQGAAK